MTFDVFVLCCWFVCLQDGKSDILIGSFKHRNRVLNSDIVAIQLNDEEDWKVGCAPRMKPFLIFTV